MTFSALPTTLSRELPLVVRAVRTGAPPVPRDVQLRVLETTQKYVQLASELFGREFLMPTVAFDLRGKTAGQAFIQKNALRFNAILLVENEDAFLSDTVPHEVAHLIARQLFGLRISAHGAEWKDVMRRFGCEPRRCHSFDVTNSAVGTVYPYQCRCPTVHMLSARRHKQAAAGRLTCRTCKTKLRPRVDGASAVSAAPVVSRAPTKASTPGPVVKRFGTGILRPEAKPSPATGAMLQFALELAHRLGIVLLPEHVGTYEQCAAFLERNRSIARAQPEVMLPTLKQLSYAAAIARKRGIAVPAAALADGRQLSQWISRNS